MVYLQLVPVGCIDKMDGYQLIFFYSESKLSVCFSLKNEVILAGGRLLGALKVICSQTEKIIKGRGYLNLHYQYYEGIEEIKTADLPYIATDYFIALKFLSTSAGSSRVDRLQKANSYLEQFIDWLSLFGLVEKPLATKDPIQSRLQKIIRFQQIRELQLDPNCTKDEESLRIYWLHWLKVKGLKAFDECSLIDAEIELLNNKEAGFSHPEIGSQKAESVIRTQQPFVLTKEKVKEGVFRPGHNLPSMSIDEFLRLEMERGNIISGSGDTKQSKDPENDAEFDVQTAKMRKRDNRWDWMTKGYGNTYNRS